jgi:hypothetical protein
VQSASECKHFVYLSIQNGTYVMVCELVQRRRVLFVTKLSFYCEYKREGRNSIIHKCYCQELDLKVFGGERVEKKEYQSRAWLDGEEYCSGEKGTRPVRGVC